MKKLVFALLLAVAGTCAADDASEFKPAETNVWGAEYPRIDAAGRVLVRIKAPDANKVKLNFWSGPKVDMEKQADGFWTVTTTPLVPGLHYYVINVDGADLAIWHTHLGTASGARLTTGDANADGATDGADYLIWQQLAGSPKLFPTTPATIAVPEPAAALLALVAAARLASQLRRDSRTVSAQSRGK